MEEYQNKAEEKAITPSMEVTDVANDKPIVPTEMQWSTHEGRTVFAPCTETIPAIPSGVYRIEWANSLGTYLRRNNGIFSDELIELPIPECREIINDIRQFWEPETKAQFKKYKTVYKRGIIVYGPPGNGKSYMMQMIISDIVKLNGVVITLETLNSVELFVSFAQKFRAIEPERPLIVILEDIDNVIEAGSSILSALMNVLDGVNQIDNVVYLATTNYPEKLQERISNRPSRFDRVYQVDSPSAEVRRYYIEKKLNTADLMSIDMDKWVKETDGLSLSHIKELIVSVIIMDKKFEDVIKHFDLMKKPKTGRGVVKKVGFEKTN